MLRALAILCLVMAFLTVVGTPSFAQTISWLSLSAEVGSGLQTPSARAHLSDSQHGGVIVHIESSDTTLALVTDNELTPGSGSVDVFVPNGSTDAIFYVQALEDTTGRVYLTATASGFGAGLDSVDVVTPSLRPYGLNPSSDPFDPDDAFIVQVGIANATNTLLSALQKVRVGGPGLTATLTNSNAAAAQLVTTTLTGQTVSVTIDPGQYTSPTTVASGGVAFDGLAQGVTEVEATIPGFNPLASGNPQTVTVTEPVITMISFPANVGSGLQNDVTRARLSGSAHGGITVHLESSDSNLVLLSTGRYDTGSRTLDVFVPDGYTDANFYTQAFEDTTGFAVVTATATGFTPGLGNVTVVDPYFRLSGLLTTIDTLDPSDSFILLVGLPDGSFNTIIALQQARGGGPGLTFTVTSSDETVGLLETTSTLDDTATVHISPGEYSSPANVALGGVAFDGVGAGTAQVTASHPFVLPVTQGTADVTVTQPTTSFISIPSTGVGAGLQPTTLTRARLSASAHGGVTVHVEVSDSTLAALSTSTTAAGIKALDIFVPNGQTDASFYIQGIEDTTGTVTLTANTPGFSGDTTTVDVVQPWLGITGLYTTLDTLDPPDNFYAQSGVVSGPSFYPQRVRGGSPGVVVTAMVDDTLVARVSTQSGSGDTVTVVIPAGSYLTPTTVGTGGVALDPVGAGTVNVSVSAPGFVDDPAWETKTVTVTAPSIDMNPLGDVGAGLQSGLISGALSASAHGGVTVRVESLEPSLALVSNAIDNAGQAFVDVYVPDGSTGFNFYVHGLEDTTGTATVTVTCAGFTADTDSVDIVTPGVGIVALGATIDAADPPDEFYTQVGLPSSGNDHVISAQKRRAGAPPLVVTIVSSDGATAQLVRTMQADDTLSVLIPAGSSFSPTTVADGGIALDGLASGQTVVSASIPGFITTGDGQRTVDVSNQNVFINGLASRLGKGLQSLAASARLGEPFHGGTTVHVEVDDTTRAVVSSNALTVGGQSVDLYLDNGATEALFYLQALDTGLVHVTATANTFNTGGQDVDIVAAGTRIFTLADTLATTDPDDEFVVQVGAVNADSSDIVEPQGLRGGGPSRTLTVASSAPTLAFIVLGNDLDAAVGVTLQPGEAETKPTVSAGGLALTPWNVGTVTVTASTPDFVTTTAGSHDVVLTGTPTGAEGNTPAVFALEQNVPNPFNPSTTIAFALPAAGPVELAVYDVAGRRIATLVDRHMSAGAASVQWSGLTDRGTRAASGVYFYRLVAGSHTQTRKMVLLK